MVGGDGDVGGAGGSHGVDVRATPRSPNPQQTAPFYSEIGRPSIDPELMIRMLIVGYC
jgi:hypothetical protein